jgi:hypothetical protein
MADTVHQADIKGENISSAVKGFALKQFKLRQVCMQQTSSDWTETYYRETAAELSALDKGTGIAIGPRAASSGVVVSSGVGRLAAFPHVDPSWTKVQGRHVKFAAEGLISVEDKLTSALDVQARTILRVSRAIANAVDSYIYTTLSATSGINTAAAGANWDSATIADRDPISDILAGIQALDEDNYDALENGYLLLSPKDYKNLMMNSKVINNPSFKTADIVSNGRVGQICGLTIIKTTSVTADEAMIIIGQRAATWKSAVPLRSSVVVDEGIKYTIRSWEIGHLQVTDPEAIHVISNTQV